MRGGYVFKSKLKGRRTLCTAVLFFSQRRVHESLFAGTVALIDEISTKRIHIEEKIKGREATTGNTSAVRRLFKFAQTQK